MKPPSPPSSRSRSDSPSSAARSLRLEPLGALDASDAELAALARDSGNVFATPEFLSLWWESFGRDGALRAYAARDENGALAGLLPLYEWRSRPVRVFRFLGHGAGDQLGPVSARSDRATLARSLLAALDDAGAPLLVGDQLPLDERWSELLGGTSVSTEGSPVLRFVHERWDDYLAAQSANLRQQIRRLERRLANAHEIRFGFPSTEGEFDAGLDTLFALHRARWSGRETNFSRREEFHRRFATAARERGWARLWLLEVDGSPAAAWYGLRFGGAESYYQMGRDPAWDRASVGSILLVHSMREALRDGMREYRFLRGGEEYKYRFASDDPGLESVLVGRGAGGAALLAAARPALALRRLGRRSPLARRPRVPG